MTGSCTLTGAGVCIELAGYADMEGWCTSIARIYAIPTAFDPAACPGDSIAVCDVDDLSLAPDFPVPALVYYYSDFAGDPATVCGDTGGTLL